MGEIKNFLRSKWVYKLTDNQIFAFETGIVAMSMGASFLFMTIVPSPGGIKAILVATAMMVTGLAIVVFIAYVMNKTREEIKRPE